MLKVVDLICTKCKTKKIDAVVKNDKEKHLCELCNEPMERLFTRVKYTTKNKEHPYPTHNLGSGEKARFGH